MALAVNDGRGLPVMRGGSRSVAHGAKGLCGPRCVDRSMAETIDLTAATTGVRLRAGETARLCLVESPSTGFLWARVGDLPPGLVEVENTFAPSGPGIGGSGRRCITYRFAGGHA